MENPTNLAIGLWKFKDTVPLSRLLEVAQDWSKEPAYTHLYLRKCSKDQHAIGFEYELSEKSEKAHRDYFDQTSDLLKRSFGNDFVGWDVSSGNNVHIVK